MKSPSRCCKTLHPQCIVNTTLRLVNWGSTSLTMQRESAQNLWNLVVSYDMIWTTERHEFKHGTTWVQTRNDMIWTDMIWMTKRHDLKDETTWFEDKTTWFGWSLVIMSFRCQICQFRTKKRTKLGVEWMAPHITLHYHNLKNKLKSWKES